MFLFPEKNSARMSNYAYFNTNIVNFIRIDIVLFKYNALYFTYLPPKHDFSHIFPSCLLFTAESQQFHLNVVLLHNNIWLRNISTKFRRLLKQLSVFYFRFCGVAWRGVVWCGMVWYGMVDELINEQK